MALKVGDLVTSERGHTAIIVGYKNNREVTIEYPSGQREVHQGIALVRGKFKDKGQPTYLGVGILGYDHINSREQSYVTWSNMLNRVYAPRSKKEELYYGGCSVVDEWLYLQTFKKWFGSQVYYNGYHLDKDLLNKGNRVYGPEFCVFLPQEINKFLNKARRNRGKYPLGVVYMKCCDKWQAAISVNGKGVYLGLFKSPEEAFVAYKKAKEDDAKRLAKLRQSKIDLRAFEALNRFEVQIDD